VRRATVLIVILLAVLMLAACGKQAPLGSKTASTPAPPAAPRTTSSKTTAKTATTAIAPRTARDGCEAVAAPKPKPDGGQKLSRRKLSRKGRYVAVLVTNCGTIRIQLAVLRAPKTTSSFAGLARSKFYDGLTFHRIARPGGNDYVIQGGDPLLTGNGGPGYTVVEKPAKKTRYVKGVVAMAKTQDDPPGASGSQFFIVTADLAPLPPDYAILGRVVGGAKVVSRIARLATDPATDQPIDPVVIKTIRIERR
jgi:cyclophilin family peptidyl-prolyl cis-trans isomerase/predicted small lipoprotein YifL